MNRTRVRTLSAGVAGAALVLTGAIAPVAYGAGECPECMSTAPQTVKSNGKTYELVWSDEFNGDALDTDVWKTQTTPENGSMKYDNSIGKRGEANISVGDGFLRLQAFQTEQKGKFNASSANIATVGTKAWKYGRFETRMKFPDSPGVWPAGWMMPETRTYGWPRDGEIDWIEYPSSDGKDVNQTVLHSSSESSTRQLNDQGTTGFYRHDSSLGGKWIKWAMEWDESGFKFFVNDNPTPYKTISVDYPLNTTGQSGSSQNVKWDSSFKYDNGKVRESFTEMEPFDQKFYMILNLGTRTEPQGASSKRWAYAFWDEMNWDQLKFDVDYFRVYQTAEQKAEQQNVFLRFDTMGQGSVSDDVKLQTRKVGQKAGQLPVPNAPRGMKFDGWYADTWIRGSDGERQFGKPITADTVISGDTIAMAKWSPDPDDPTDPTDPDDPTDPTGDLAVSTPNGVFRAGEANRYETAVNIATRFDPGVDVLYLASGATYPDALIASALAGQQESPVLLVEPSKIPTSVQKAISKLAPKRVVIVGGPGAVSPNVESQAKQLVGASKVTRLQGDNRFETASALAADAFQGKSAKTVYIASGMDFPDALAASAGAAFEDAPVLLVMKDNLPDSTAKTVAKLNPQRVVVVGGPGVVSDQVAKQAAQKAGLTKFERLGGQNRFETSQKVAQNVFGTAKFAAVANGMQFPDALVGSALAGANGGPVLLTEAKTLNQETSASLKTLKPKSVMVAGGDAVVSEQVRQLIAKITRL